MTSQVLGSPSRLSFGLLAAAWLITGYCGNLNSEQADELCFSIFSSVLFSNVMKINFNILNKTKA